MTGIDIISDSTGKEIVAAIQSTDIAQARILEINTAAELKKNEVLNSIPEDYSNIANEVNELKGDLDEIDTVLGIPITTDIFNSEFDVGVGCLVGYDAATFEIQVRTTSEYENYRYATFDISNVAYETLKLKLPSSPLIGVMCLFTDLSTKAIALPLKSLLNGYDKYGIKYDVGNDYYTLNVNTAKSNGYTKFIIGYKTVDTIYALVETINTDGLIFNVKTLETLIPRVETLEESYVPPLMCNLNMFNSVGAIGDSYTKTLVIKSDNTGVEMPERGWLATMSKRAGNNYNIYAVSGATTRSILTEQNGLLKALSNNADDCYFYALGINDSEQLGVDYLGSIADITSDYTQNPDTFYGNYARIIEQIMAHAPNAKHIMFKIPMKNHDYYITFSNAIEEIANHYGIMLINPFDDDFYESSIYNNKVLGHPTCMGYSGMGLANERLFSKLVKNNIQYFLYSTVG